MSKSLSGRVSVMAGGVRGIGGAIAGGPPGDGATVFALDRISPPEIGTTVPRRPRRVTHALRASSPTRATIFLLQALDQPNHALIQGRPN